MSFHARRLQLRCMYVCESREMAYLDTFGSQGVRSGYLMSMEADQAIRFKILLAYTMLLQSNNTAKSRFPVISGYHFRLK